ncbi:hypothetical protein TIFTF001_038903 [Ficus carica]|uniref:Pyrrolo-quinoline quinone repeat domain-containing protein n=1 Tax=Ficus carica TaxID=3494 RepID=A0AA88ECS9_FICCA|nr:hypothetical protein TIFTF001_038903 [Ficus carica]
MASSLLDQPINKVRYTQSAPKREKFYGRTSPEPLYMAQLHNGRKRLQKRARDNWSSHSGDLYNRRCAKTETKIIPETASKLRLKWEFYAGKDITATPAIFEGTLYFPSWNGYLYAVNASEGSLVWKSNLQNLTGLKPTGFVFNVNWTVSRATPTVAGDDLLIVSIYEPAVVIAVKRSTGELVWSTQLSSNVAGVITMSETYYRG